MVKLLLGLVLLCNGMSLLLFTMGELQSGLSPIVTEQDLAEDTALLVTLQLDPLPQALVINVLLISFALLAAVLVLVYRTSQVIRSDDLDDLIATDYE